jgi:hypothetical protein
VTHLDPGGFFSVHMVVVRAIRLGVDSTLPFTFVAATVIVHFFNSNRNGKDYSWKKKDAVQMDKKTSVDLTELSGL